MKKILLALAVFVALALIISTTVIINVDPNIYREQIAGVLSKKTGRDVKLDGAIHLGLSLNGLTVSISDAALGNPVWASRKALATIGKFELGIETLPLLQHKLVITALTIANADIQFEAAPDGSNNWDLVVSPEGPSTEGNVQVATSSVSTSPIVSVGCDNLTITDSQVALRGKNGRTEIFKVDSFILTQKGQGLDAIFRGMYNSTPIALKAQTTTTDIMGDHDWPLTLDLVYDFYRVQANGIVNLSKKTADLPFLTTIGKSDLVGRLAIDWSGSRPLLKGNVASTHLAAADFKPSDENIDSDVTQTKSTQPAVITPITHIFSNESLGFDFLKQVDASIDIALKDLVLPAVSLQQVDGHILLQDADLDMPLRAALGESVWSLGIKLNAGISPARLGVTIASSNADFSDLLTLMGLPAFVSGRTEANAVLGAVGNNLHALASSLTGTMDIVTTSGAVSRDAAKDIPSKLLEIIAPGGSSALNCVAARFIASNGMVRDNGILIDTAVTTIAGSGGVNLATETIDMDLRAQTKVVAIGSLLPPLFIGGTFLHPKFSFDPQAVVQNVVGVFSGNIPSNNVPEVISESGQNACLYTLTHPSGGGQSLTNPILPGLQGEAQKLKNIGKRIFPSMFGQ